MKKITIAIDCDGTLITTDSVANKRVVANERIRTLLITLASMKNTRIIVWSGSGEYWAQFVGNSLGLDKYVNQYMAKNDDLKPDLAIDDVQACELGEHNLIIKEK